MTTAKWGLLLLLPALMGFESSDARDTLGEALRNLYGADLLAAVELRIHQPSGRVDLQSFAYGRKRTDGETRTLVYSVAGGREAPRALLLQKDGQGDKLYVSNGTHGQVRALATGKRRWALFGSDFAYEDFRSHRANEYRIEVLGEETIDREPCRVLRLRPVEGPYEMILAWVSTKRPVFVRMDLFDEKGLWKRYRADVRKMTEHLDSWVSMEDEMFDLRTGRRTKRTVKNILVETQVPDEVFTLTQLTRGRLPRF